MPYGCEIMQRVSSVHCRLGACGLQPAPWTPDAAACMALRCIGRLHDDSERLLLRVCIAVSSFYIKQP